VRNASCGIERRRSSLFRRIAARCILAPKQGAVADRFSIWSTRTPTSRHKKAPALPRLTTRIVCAEITLKQIWREAWNHYSSKRRGENRQTRERVPTSMESPFRKSSSAFFPASRAARWERKPPSHIRTPMGLRLRRISQHQGYLPLPLRKIAT
jgi:hypothetical protein